MIEGNIVQFNENHKWCGCLGIICEIKDCGRNGTRYMVGIPIPQKGTAFIYVMENENAIELCGNAILGITTLKENEDDK